MSARTPCSSAADAFRKLKGLTGHTDWCFPGRGATNHMDVKSVAKQLGDRQCMFKKSKDGGARKLMKNRRHDNTLVLSAGKTGAWTPHDLRRTGATLMQRLKVPLDIIDRCQNHVLEGSKVRRSYLRNVLRAVGCHSGGAKAAVAGHLCNGAPNFDLREWPDFLINYCSGNNEI